MTETATEDTTATAEGVTDRHRDQSTTAMTEELLTTSPNTTVTGEEMSASTLVRWTEPLVGDTTIEGNGAPPNVWRPGFGALIATGL